MVSYTTSINSAKLEQLLRHRLSWFWLLGLSLIILGLVYLQTVFNAESDEAKGQLEAQQSALNQFVIKSFQQILHHRIELAKGSILHLSNDPLLPDKGLLYFRQGEQRLPRLAEHPSHTEQSARQLYQWILDIDPLDLIIENAGAWEERLNLLSDFKLALLNDNLDEVRWSFRAIREHRAQNHINADKDIPFMLAIIVYLTQHAEVAPSLVTGILRDGSIVEQENGVFGLQRQLLQNRGVFTRADFDFLVQTLADICQQFSVPVRDFLEQAAIPSQHVDAADFADWRAGIKGHWYIEPVSSEEFIGVPISLENLVKQVKHEMQILGLLGEFDEINISGASNDFRPMNNMNLQISSPYWEEKISQIDRRWRLKSFSLLAFGILSLSIFIVFINRMLKEQKLIDIKSEFIATVSHELRTPITSLRVMADALQKHGSESAITKSYPQRISNVLNDLGLLVENILSFNRISKGLININPARFALTDLIHDILFEYKQYADFNINAEVNLSGLELEADEGLIRILFRNLLTNSIKFNDHSHIEIKLSYDPKRGNILYQDNAQGIAKDKWDSVFDEFVSFRPGSQSSSGTGLGLALCRRIVELHQGRIAIQSSDQHGSVFSIHIPAITHE